MMLSTGAKRWAIGAVRSSSILTGALFFADGLLANLLRSTTNEDDHFSGMNDEEAIADMAGRFRQLTQAWLKTRGL